MEGDVMRTITAHHDAFAHYHVAGNPGRHEPDRSQELWYPAIYEAIAATGFDGYVGMEYIPRGKPLQSLQTSLDELRAATT
jgi:hydroxypyruvate isomerase